MPRLPKFIPRKLRKKQMLKSVEKANDLVSTYGGGASLPLMVGLKELYKFRDVFDSNAKKSYNDLIARIARVGAAAEIFELKLDSTNSGVTSVQDEIQKRTKRYVKELKSEFPLD